MSTRARIVAGCLVATAGFGVLVVGVAGALLDWGAGTTTTVEAAEPTGDAASTTTTTTVATATETPEEFLAELATALRAVDVDLLLDRLHPAVVERYGAEQCRAYLASQQNPDVEFTVTAVSQPGPYDWTTDDVTTSIPDTLTVDTDRTQGGQTTPVQVHITEVDGRFTWFTDCGTPA